MIASGKTLKLVIIDYVIAISTLSDWIIRKTHSFLSENLPLEKVLSCYVFNSLPLISTLLPLERTIAIGYCVPGVKNLGVYMTIVLPFNKLMMKFDQCYFSDVINAIMIRCRNSQVAVYSSRCFCKNENIFTQVCTVDESLWALLINKSFNQLY